MEFKENPEKLGFIQKTHGVRGGLVIESFRVLPEHEDLPEWVFIELEGGLVPFYLKSEESFIRDDKHLVIFLDGIDTPEAAFPLTHSLVCVPASFFNSEEEVNAIAQISRGFKVVIEGIEEIGSFVELMEIPGNPLFAIDLKGKEILVPANEQFVLSIDHDKQTVYLRIPDELLDLN